MLPPGFEPESSPREGEMIGRTTLQEHINNPLPLRTFVLFLNVMESYINNNKLPTKWTSIDM